MMDRTPLHAPVTTGSPRHDSHRCSAAASAAIGRVLNVSAAARRALR